MSKPKTQPVGLSYVNKGLQEDKEKVNEPLSGSKKVKNRNHSRHNHGEGF
jgi:small acid-soluble spore protein P (minor)